MSVSEFDRYQYHFELDGMNLKAYVQCYHRAMTTDILSMNETVMFVHKALETKANIVSDSKMSNPSIE